MWWGGWRRWWLSMPCGVSGGVPIWLCCALQVYSKLAEGVERMSWLERYLPSSVAQRLSDRLAGASQWARGLSRERTGSQGSQVSTRDH